MRSQVALQYKEIKLSMIQLHIYIKRKSDKEYCIKDITPI